MSRLLLCMRGMYEAGFVWTSTKNKIMEYTKVQSNQYTFSFSFTCNMSDHTCFDLLSRETALECTKSILTLNHCYLHSLTFGDTIMLLAVTNIKLTGCPFRLLNKYNYI